MPWLGLLCLPSASAAAAALLLVFGEPTRADFAAGLLVLLSLASAVVITVCLARMVPSMLSRAGAACCVGAFGLLCLAPFVPDIAFYVGLIASWGIGMGLSLVSLLVAARRSRR